MFTLTAIVEYIVVALAAALLYALCTRRLLGALQQGGYEGRAYARWTHRKGNMVYSRYILLAFLIALASLVFGICFTFAGDWAAYIALVPIPGFVAVYCVSERRALKVPLRCTRRAGRISALNALLLFLVCFALVLAANAAAFYAGAEIVAHLRYLPLAVVPILLPVLLRLAAALERPYATARNRKYVAAAREKLASAPCKKIGITGSFGKTSVKNFLAALLSERYTVVATPASYNTPVGIAKAAEGADLSAADFFLAEMGARRAGDIEELASLVAPDHCILTGVCPQHVETFGSVEAVLAEKAKLLSGTKAGGFAVVGMDENTRGLDLAALPLQCIRVGEGEAFGARNIRLSAEGAEFELMLAGEGTEVRTRLLGRHSVHDLALAAAMAHCLGIPREEIVRGIAQMGYVPHRLQPIESGGVTVLDDAYNANVEGAACALEVLRLFAGRKFAVTPGIVELGILEERENRLLGERLAGLDGVVLVGETLVLPVKEGYLAAGGDPEKLHILPTLEKAQALLAEVLQDGDTVLFLNDLPDIYS